MIDKHMIFEIHRLHREGWPKTKIADSLHLNRKTIRKFLQDPDPPKLRVKRSSKLDPFKEQIDMFLKIDAGAPATVMWRPEAVRERDGAFPAAEAAAEAGSPAETASASGRAAEDLVGNPCAANGPPGQRDSE